jgi:hypothetical protein
MPVGIRSAVVTGNCNAGGIVEGLQAVLGDIEITGFASWDLETDDQIVSAVDAISDADVWLRMPMAVNERLDAQVHASEVIDLPNIVFSAFHPDAIYALRGDGSLFRGITDYHSAIGLWAWRKGLGPDAAARLFTTEVMKALTYDRYWGPSVQAVKRDFAASSLSFPAFWMRLKRTGVFMHTVNHPTGGTLSLLAKAIAVRLGAPDHVWDIPAERYTQDFLTHIVWPVYPWVGQSLGVEGCFTWKMEGRVYQGVETWLQATWEAYGDASVDDLHSDRINDGVYDLVLGRASRDAGIVVPS